jgi:hypothetical protein
MLLLSPNEYKIFRYLLPAFLYDKASVITVHFNVA